MDKLIEKIVSAVDNQHLDSLELLVSKDFNVVGSLDYIVLEHKSIQDCVIGIEVIRKSYVDILYIDAAISDYYFKKIKRIFSKRN